MCLSLKMDKRSRDNDDEDNPLKIVREHGVSFFHNMSDDVLLEFLLSGNFNMIQIYNLCLALRADRTNRGGDICERKKVWDRLFKKRFGKDEFDRIVSEEKLTDPFKRVAAYSLWAMPEIQSRFNGIWFQNRKIDDYGYVYNSGTEISIYMEENGNVEIQGKSTRNRPYWDEEVLQDVLKEVAQMYGITKDDNDPWITEDFIFIYDGVTIASRIEANRYVRAVIYVFLSKGWAPYRQNGKPVWTKSCISCGTEKAKYTCAGCLKVEYCGVECAKTHWIKHKPICERMSREKARKILHDGHVKGHPLTDRQRRYFGWLSNH